MPSLFTDIGFADTRPIANNTYALGRVKNRRVEILILKNKDNSMEYPQNEIMKMSKEEQAKMQAHRFDTINKIEALEHSTKKANADEEKQYQQDASVVNSVYQKEIKRLSTQTDALDSDVKMKITGQGDWLRPPALIKKLEPKR